MLQAVGTAVLLVVTPLDAASQKTPHGLSVSPHYLRESRARRSTPGKENPKSEKPE